MESYDRFPRLKLEYPDRPILQKYRNILPLGAEIKAQGHEVQRAQIPIIAVDFKLEIESFVLREVVS